MNIIQPIIIMMIIITNTQDNHTNKHTGHINDNANANNQ